MKAVNKISQILAIVFSAAAVIFFFLPFANVQAVGGDHTFIGAELCFGTKVDGYGQLYQSSQILFCFIVSVISVLFAGLTFKFKKIRYWAPAVALTAAIYMLVITLSLYIFSTTSSSEIFFNSSKGNFFPGQAVLPTSECFTISSFCP